MPSDSYQPPIYANFSHLVMYLANLPVLTCIVLTLGLLCRALIMPP